MRNFTVMTVLLVCCLSRISVSEFHTVDVQSGGQVTLLCSNFTSNPTQIYWFRVVRRLKPHCVLFMYKASEPATYCDGFQHGRFEAGANVSVLFLKVSRVDPSDSGLYFCGNYINQKPLIADATYLEVKEVTDGNVKLILGGLIVFLTVVIIGLVVKIHLLWKAHTEQQNPQQTESPSSDKLIYAAVTFHPKTERDLKATSTIKVEPNVSTVGE